MERMVDFTADEIERFIRFSQTDEDLVRLVDPVSQRVCLTAGGLSEDDKDAEGRTCYSVWGRCARCDNCTSLRALQDKGTAYKMEILTGRAYWVSSRYVVIDGVEHIMETVVDVSNDLMLDSDRVDELGKIINRYNHQLVTDSLTNIYNRRFLDDDFVPSLTCCHEKGLNVCVAIMDLDAFKQVNDTYGHQAGDALLKDAAGYWHGRYHSRKTNAERLVVRYGGDEMLVIVCGMTGERFRSAIERDYRHMRKVCYFSEDVQIPFSISFGIASSDELGDDWTWDGLLALADERLYTSKG